MNNAISESYISSARKAYLTAFGIILFLTVGAQIAVQYSIYQQKQDSSVINVAGRQRMLSQRISRFANIVALERKEVDLKKLNNSIAEIESSHRDLVNGNSSRSISPPFNEQIARSYEELNPILQDLLKHARCIARSCDEEKTALTLLSESAEIFLVQMNKIVIDSSKYSAEKVAYLSILEICLFVIIVLTMIIEFFFILMPFNNRLTKLLLSEAKEEDRKQRLYHLAEIGEMTAEINHEVNNFLAIIEMASQVLARKAAASPEVDNLMPSIEKISKGVSKIQNISNGMSKLSRISYRDEFIVSEVFDDIEDMLTGKLKKQKIEIIKSNCCLDKILSNSAQVTQVLFNLAKNAVHALAQHEGERKIYLKASIKGDLVEFLVSDTGPGITEENRAKILDAYFTTKEAGEGTGLGLSLSSKIARALGGELKLIDSEYSTTFYFSIKDQKHI